MNLLKLAAAPPVLLAGMMLSDAAISYRIPIEYYAATLFVLGTIMTILKAWSWVRSGVKDMIEESMKAHVETHKALNDRLDGIILAIERLPCARTGVCDDRDSRPRFTPPVGLPVVRRERGE